MRVTTKSRTSFRTTGGRAKREERLLPSVRSTRHEREVDAAEGLDALQGPCPPLASPEGLRLLQAPDLVWTFLKHNNQGRKDAPIRPTPQNVPQTGASLIYTITGTPCACVCVCVCV